MTKDECIQQMARTIWLAEHPRKAWQVAPNYTQAKVQDRYISTARVCFDTAMKVFEDDDRQRLADIAAGRSLNTVTRR